MKPILTGIVLTLMTLQLHGQNSTILSSKGQETLYQIYQTPLGGAHLLINSGKPSIEDEYLRLYGLFMAYLSSEQDVHANNFHAGIKTFEASHKDEDRFHLMYVTLLIQQSILHWSNEDYTSGIRSFYKAHRLFAKTDSSHFSNDYQKLNGLFNVLHSQVPDQYRFWTSLLGINGDADTGFQLLNNFMHTAHSHKGSTQEAMVLYSYCLLKFGSPTNADVINLIHTTKHEHGPLLSFVVASLTVKNQLGDEGLCYLETVPETDFQAFPLLFHIKGRLLLNQLDSTAIHALQRFRTIFKGQSFRTDALMREAWWWHIHLDTGKRDSMMKLAERQEKLPTSNDKQAKKELTTLKDEPVALLKARLLFDGGYYERARLLLSSTNAVALSDYYLPEYHYRLGRVHQALKKHQEALLSFDKVIALCQDDKRYIGPYAALEAASIAFHLNDRERTKQYLKMSELLNTGLYKSDINAKILSLKQLLDN